MRVFDFDLLLYGVKLSAGSRILFNLFGFGGCEVLELLVLRLSQIILDNRVCVLGVQFIFNF
jgi:hypothetical protein